MIICQQARQGRLANGINVEAHLVKFFVINKISPIEDKGRLDHGFVDSFIIQFFILLPFCKNGNGMSIVRSHIRIEFKGYAVCQLSEIITRILHRMRISNNDIGMFFQ